MLILGIDPGTATTGFGLIDSNGKGVNVVDWGLIETNKDGVLGARLEIIHKQILDLLEKHNPDIMAIERIFFARNAKTAIAVGQAQGVMILAASMYKKEVVEYAPMTIKKVITGSGNADKKSVQKALRSIFGAKIKSKAKKRTHFDNAADALAIAFCHAIKMNENLKGGDK
ncbi:crossover junction endodeoxyribonuclease RuvC [Candidatus Woesebacteria bacterium]|nr:crossover junction endodeoxyribonuclease RuvC [Candidatus Woesebacteria bacterium]